MDIEIAQVSGRSSQAVLGLMELKVVGTKKAGPATVTRCLVVRRQYRVSDPIGPCADKKEREALDLLPSMVHINPVDLYRGVERSAD